MLWPYKHRSKGVNTHLLHPNLTDNNDEQLKLKPTPSECWAEKQCIQGIYLFKESTKTCNAFWSKLGLSAALTKRVLASAILSLLTYSLSKSIIASVS